MAGVRVKLCGMMTPADAAAAAEAGADAIGMILHANAPRRISPEVAAEIVRILPPFVLPVGVFVDAGDQIVLDTAKRLGLATVQLHGCETPADVATIAPLRVIKAVKVAAATIRQTLAGWREAVAAGEITNLSALLLEAPTAAAGGTGEENDFGLIETLLGEGAFAGLPPIIVAGGLRPDNVGPVVRRLRPYGVDVSSGIEESRGKKSLAKMRAFAANANSGSSPCRGG
jgi:phosphoribosylanthranilate isomerase